MGRLPPGAGRLHPDLQKMSRAIALRNEGMQAGQPSRIAAQRENRPGTQGVEPGGVSRVTSIAGLDGDGRLIVSFSNRVI